MVVIEKELGNGHFKHTESTKGEKPMSQLRNCVELFASVASVKRNSSHIHVDYKIQAQFTVKHAIESPKGGEWQGVPRVGCATKEGELGERMAAR